MARPDRAPYSALRSAYPVRGRERRFHSPEPTAQSPQPARFHACPTARAAKYSPHPVKKPTGSRHPRFAWNSGTRLDAPT
jgi:hypothetical protein